MAMSNEISFLYKHQGGTEPVLISINTENIPVGSTVSLNTNQTGPQPPIQIKATTVNTYPNFSVSLNTTINQGFSGMITLQLTYPDDQADLSIRSVNCTIAIQSSSITTLFPYDLPTERLKSIGPSRLTVLKNVSTEFQASSSSSASSLGLLEGTEYSFTKDGVMINVNANLGTTANIEGVSNVESTLVETCLGIRKTHTFGNSCTGDWGNSKYYVHIMNTNNQDLLGYANVIEIVKDKKYSIDVDATGVVKGGIHKFNTKGKF